MITDEQRVVITSMPVVRGKRNGLFWAHNDANLLADLSHMGLCKMPFADRWGVSGWQFVARIKRPGLLARAAIAKATPTKEPTPDIEALKAYLRTLVGRTSTSVFKDCLATITDLQARVVEQDAALAQAGRTLMTLDDTMVAKDAEIDTLRAQLTAFQAEVARQAEVIKWDAEKLVQTTTAIVERDLRLETLRADLAAHKAAVAEAVRRADGYEAGRVVKPSAMWVTEPLRALAEPAKQSEGDALAKHAPKEAAMLREIATSMVPAHWWEKNLTAAAECLEALAARGLSVGEGK